MSSTKSFRPSCDPFAVAEQLTAGAPLSIVPVEETQNVLTALCSLRHEAMNINTPKSKIDFMTSIIIELESTIKIPKGNNYSRSVTGSARRTNRKRNQMTQDEIDNLNDVIDIALQDGIIEYQNEDEKQKLLKLLHARRQDEIDDKNYYEVEKLDNLIKYIHLPLRTPEDILYERLHKLEDDLEQIRDKYDLMDIEKSRSINRLIHQQDDDYQILLDLQEQEMVDFCETLPQYDEKGVKFSRAVLTMRANEQSFVKGGDYDGATLLHQKVTDLEEKERQQWNQNISTSVNLRTKKEEDRQRLQRECFIARWNAKLDKLTCDWDRKLRVTKVKEEAILEKIDTVKKKLGIKMSTAIYVPNQ